MPRNLFILEHLIAEANEHAAHFFNDLLEMLKPTPLRFFRRLSTLPKYILGLAISLSARLPAVSTSTLLR